MTTIMKFKMNKDLQNSKGNQRKRTFLISLESSAINGIGYAYSQLGLS